MPRIKPPEAVSKSNKTAGISPENQRKWPWMGVVFCPITKPRMMPMVMINISFAFFIRLPPV